ncbi:MAG TPA: CD225/dispanin family protein [Chitinophagaceae bacterium]|nr:CD225/dispanin family protein [Chitinophagaceae bacterium]
MAREYFFEKHNQQYGPVSLADMIESGITEDNYIWYEGLDDWIEAREDPKVLEKIREFKALNPPPFGIANRFRNDPPQQEDYSAGKVMPPTNLVLGIISLLIGCWPLGIVAIYFASQVKKLFLNGEYAKAIMYSNRARNISIVSIAIGLIFGLIYFILISTGVVDIDALQQL